MLPERAQPDVTQYSPVTSTVPSLQVEMAREEERARIAREIHDEMGGNLTAIKMSLALLKKSLPNDDIALAEKALYLDKLVDHTIDAMHRLANNLRPAVLDLGLVAACEWQVQEFSKHTAIECKFISRHKNLLLRADLMMTLSRLLQECLTNVAKHAGASQVCVELTADKRTVRMRILDNGCGISPASLANENALGIRGMRERASQVGGTFAITGNADGGSIAVIALPRVGP